MRNRFISSIWVHSATETIPNVSILYMTGILPIQQGTSPVSARNQRWFFSITGICIYPTGFQGPIYRFSGAHLQVFKGPSIIIYILAICLQVTHRVLTTYFPTAQKKGVPFQRYTQTLHFQVRLFVRKDSGTPDSWAMKLLMVQKSG